MCIARVKFGLEEKRRTRQFSGRQGWLLQQQWAILAMAASQNSSSAPDSSVLSDIRAGTSMIGSPGHQLQVSPPRTRAVCVPMPLSVSEPRPFVALATKSRPPADRTHSSGRINNRRDILTQKMRRRTKRPRSCHQLALLRRNPFDCDVIPQQVPPASDQTRQFRQNGSQQAGGDWATQQAGAGGTIIVMVQI
jgi:hypothetical protein